MKRLLRRWSPPALPVIARTGALPPNELASFMDEPCPRNPASALLSLNVKKALPPDLLQSVLDHVTDPNETVRQAAMLAVVPLQLQPAVPKLLELARTPGSPDHATAVEALCGLRDRRAVAVYVSALDGEDPRLRKLALAALLAIKDQALRGNRQPPLNPRGSEPPRRSRSTASLPPSRRSRTGSDRAVPEEHAPALHTSRAAGFHQAVRRLARHPRLVDRPPRRYPVRPRRSGGFRPAGGPGTVADPAAAGLGAFGFAEVNVDRDCTVLLDCTSSGPLS